MAVGEAKSLVRPVAEPTISAVPCGHPRGAASSRPLPAGHRIGRFSILEALGRGGMGDVYRAHDPELDRCIAIKIVRAEAHEQDRSVQLRLQREARALAKVSHPNVVAIYDVGTCGGDLFIAMELVDGLTVKAWLAQRRRSVPRILGVFIEAARGLQAAHDAGLVHRDFKPSNVMIGFDARVRVLDFGLVRATTATCPDDDLGLWSDSGRGSDEHESGLAASSLLTVAGSVMGTPGYISPEQILGRPADARSDQFSFCVTLFEALFGRRPFLAKRWNELRRKVLRGDVDMSLEHPDVGPWLRRVLLRGLSRNPDARFPSMAELAEALSHRPEQSWRRGIAAGLGLSAVAIGGWAALPSLVARQDLCSPARDALHGVWDESARHRVTAAFAASGRRYASDTAERVSALLDAYGEAWIEARVDACEATRVRGEQSERVLDLRMACLDRRKHELRATVGVLAQTGDRTIDESISLAANLVPLEVCGDVERLMLTRPLPEDPAVAAQVDELQAELDDIDAMRFAGQVRPALVQMQRAMKRGQALDYAPLRARSLTLLGDLQSQLGDCRAAAAAYESAIFAAGEARDDARIAQLRGRSLVVAVRCLGQTDALDLLQRTAVQAVARVEGDPTIKSEVWQAIGSTLEHVGRYPQARAYLEESLDLSEGLWGASHPNTAQALDNLASLLEKQGDYQAARRALVRALDIREQAFGPQHPSIAAVLDTLGFVRETPEAGLADLRRGLEIRIAATGENHPAAAMTLANIGFLQVRLGRFDEAWGSYQRALRSTVATLGPDHAQTALVLTDIGNLLRVQGRYRRAREFYRHAERVAIAALGPDHPQSIRAISDLALVTFRLGEVELAEHKFAEALELGERVLGPNHPRLSAILSDLGMAALAKRDFDRALGFYQRSLDIKQATLGPGHADTIETSLALANVYLQRGNPDAAAVRYEQALERAEALLGEGHRTTVGALRGLGESHLPTHPTAAAFWLERAFAIAQRVELDALGRGDVAFAYARAIWAAEADRQRAAELVREAEHAYEASEDASARRRRRELARFADELGPT